MECHKISTAKIVFLTSRADKHMRWILWPTRKLNLENIYKVNYVSYSSQASSGRHSIRHTSWQTFCTHVILEEEFSSLQTENNSNDEEFSGEAAMEKVLSQPLSSAELRSLTTDSERAKLTKKLSEANQHNRLLKRQLHAKEDALVNFKSELAIMDHEIQTMVSLAEEIVKSPIPHGSRKINGKYIQSHLLLRLQAVNTKLKEQIKDVDVARSKEVHLFWSGMAESVQVMGSFDGWSQGEHLSPEFTGSYMKFHTTLLLRPGRYEIKLLVDGEWQLSPEFPTVGEGLMENNLLIVE